MRKSYTVLLRVVWILTILAIAGVLWVSFLGLSGRDWRAHAAVLLISGFILFFSVILLPMIYYYRKKYTKSENNLVESRHLAHWKYDADEWDRFTAHEWKTARNNAFWYPVGIVIVVAAFGYFFKGWGFEELKNVMPWIFALAVAIGLIILAIAQRSRKKSLQNVGETYIGEDAIQFNGKYYPWVGFGLKLGKVIFLKGDPSMLEFEIKRLTRYGYTPSEIRVPVPRAHQEEAERIVQKFSQQSANQESISSGSSRGKAK